jgi:chromosome segregation ATPase
MNLQPEQSQIQNTDQLAPLLEQTQQLQNELEQKQSTIEELRAVIAGKEAVLAEKEASITEKDKTIEKLRSNHNEHMQEFEQDKQHKEGLKDKIMNENKE